MTLREFETALNDWGNRGIPFLFIVDFEMEKPMAIPLHEVKTEEILYDLNGFSNASQQVGQPPRSGMQLTKFPPLLNDYKRRFDTVYKHLCYGDSYLTNLTVKTEVKLAGSLRDVFQASHARYKLLYKDQFLVFSPEIFIQMREGRIYSYPMKGTIDASVERAREKILSDQKELAEHVTIVDLIRNDLSRVATNVQVTRFRYIDEIRTNHKNLLQVSSEITGELAPDYSAGLGTILVELLPAGSVSGAPKPKTVEIIREAEGDKRGYYTGVFGYFDGHVLDSGVMIRFIEREGEHYFYRSGGGITTQSVAEAEYQEVIDKVYVPLD